MFRIVSLVALLVGVLAAALSYLTLSRAIARPLDEALGHFDAIAAGDLRRPVVVTSRDEMGQLLDGIAKMQRSLTETVRTVRSGSESIATATRQIAAGNIDLSSRTEEQASALQETASSMEELTGTVKQNADNARQASALAANASEIANKGSAVVGQVVGTMGDINQSSAKIADIISIIEGIAFQTNILALNAAVEAARAGEEGRGFAVVAGEVRSLAQRSSAAAKEIKELIDTSVERVQSGSALVDEAGRTMTEIIAAVQRVTDIMGEIAAASEEQSGGIEQVARAVTQMDEVTQQNAALVEEAAAAASSLEDQAGKLRTAVAVFQLEEGGYKAPVNAAPTRAATPVRSMAARKVSPAGLKPALTSAKPSAAALAPQAGAAARAPRQRHENDDNNDGERRRRSGLGDVLTASCVAGDDPSRSQKNATFIPDDACSGARVAAWRLISKDRDCVCICGLFSWCAHYVTFALTVRTLADVVIRYIDGRGLRLSRRHCSCGASNLACASACLQSLQCEAFPNPHAIVNLPCASQKGPT